MTTNTTTQSHHSAQLVVTSIFTLVSAADAERDGTDQQRLLTLLSANGHEILERTPGFLGSELISSDDGRHVVHQAYWSDERSLATMLADPAARACMHATRALATVQVCRGQLHERFNSEPLAPGSTRPVGRTVPAVPACSD